jgi:hypothetical protein
MFREEIRPDGLMAYTSEPEIQNAHDDNVRHFHPVRRVDHDGHSG